VTPTSPTGPDGTPNTGRVALAALLSGVLLFAWHGVLWAIPAHHAPIAFLDPALVETVHVGTGSQTVFLGTADDAAVPEVAWGWATTHDASSYSFPRFLGVGFVLQLLVGAAIAVVVARTRPRAGTAAALGAGAGLVAASAGVLWLANWGWFSVAYAATMTFDTVGGWALAAAMAAVLLREQRTAAIA
jgi:hypothetical protein